MNLHQKYVKRRVKRAKKQFMKHSTSSVKHSGGNEMAKRVGPYYQFNPTESSADGQESWNLSEFNPKNKQELKTVAFRA